MSVKCAEQSPRICEDGSIRWYEGDTFTLEFDLNFTDEQGNVVEVLPDDEIAICFRNKYGEILYETKVVGTSTLTININEEISNKFKEGSYTYCVRRNSIYITTLMRNNKVVVE